MAIVSHKYGFIFIKTTKTAGTSIEVALSRICGPEDVVTPVFPPEPGHEPRNCLTSEGGRFYNHMPARQIRDLIGEDRFRSYFKFCVERHPVDKCISHFNMKKYSSHHRTFGALFLTWSRYLKRRKFPLDHRKYIEGDREVLVDRIINFENLEGDLADVFGLIGLPWDGLSVRAKGSYRKSSFRAEEVKSSDREVIMEAFAPSNRFTGYT